MSTTPTPTHVPEGYSSLYKSIALYPELGLFRRFGAFWAKKLHDDTGEFQACLLALNQHLGSIHELEGKTILDCPLRVVKEKCPETDKQWVPLYNAWVDYDKALVRYGETLCRSEQIMNLPTQKAFHTKQLLSFKPPVSRSIFENNVFVPTGEDATFYQGDAVRTDTCSWRTMPQGDFLTMRFIHSSNWIEKHILAWLRRLFEGVKKSDPEYPADIRHHHIIATMDTLSCLVASGLLWITVYILAVVHPLKTRIAIIGGAGTIFALLLKLMAGNPTRGEVFGATAAFYAVATVFVGSTNNNSGHA